MPLSLTRRPVTPAHSYEKQGNNKLHGLRQQFLTFLLCSFILVTYHLHMLHSWEVEELSQLKDTIE